jgi:hypothetical protein
MLNIDDTLRSMLNTFGVEALKQRLETLAIADFSNTLEREIVALAVLKEPVWDNLKTGRRSSSRLKRSMPSTFPPPSTGAWSAVRMEERV